MTPPTIQLAFHPSAHPARGDAALRAALMARRLPGWLLYATPAQARRWLDYHAGYSPFRAEAEAGRAYDALHARVPALLPRGQAAAVVGLGCGGGRKDTRLLRLLAGEGPAIPAYLPLDASPTLALEATLHAGAELPGIQCAPMVADLEAPALWEGLAEAWPGWPPDGAPVVVTCYGLLPNLPQREMLRGLHRCLRPGDVLLLQANLSPVGHAADGARILAQYDNPLAMAWYGGALAGLGLAAGDFDLRATTAPNDDTAGELAWRITVDAVFSRETTLRLPVGEFSFGRGEPLEVFHSQRYTREGLEALLQDCGWQPLHMATDPTGEEGLAICRR